MAMQECIITYDTYQTYMCQNGLRRIQESSSFHLPTRVTHCNPRSELVAIPEFKPTLPNHTSNMEKIRGSDIQELYYALPYFWNQSVDIFRQDKAMKAKIPLEFVNGKHIYILQEKTMHKKVLRRFQFHLMLKIRSLKLEGLFQQKRFVSECQIYFTMSLVGPIFYLSFYICGYLFF
ncbi:hypothetical protein BJV82DRAFT_633191 [Fennellomyces sp. T-0311]|nr:hypothetical protein BJV82DRAFT_633191 [Fennellomyces sp. T-0311]